MSNHVKSSILSNTSRRYVWKEITSLVCLLSTSRVFLLDTAIPNRAEILKGIVLAQHVKAELRRCASLSLILSALRDLRWVSRAGQIKYTP